MDGSFERGTWHTCPCCPPMLCKIYSALGTYIYAYKNEHVFVNLYIGSQIKTDQFAIKQQNGSFTMDSFGKKIHLHFRIPDYAKNFVLYVNGKKTGYNVTDGYAVIYGVFNEKDSLKVEFKEPPRRVFANPFVKEDQGKVAVMGGAKLYCAEGIDNDGNVEFEIAVNPNLELVDDKVVGKTSDGKEFTLIPYHLWGNRRTENQADNVMAVWFRQQDMLSNEVLSKKIGDDLYADYE